MAKPKVALITGITGQDGAYLAEDPHVRGRRFLKVRFSELVAEMMREDIALAGREQLARTHGHKIHERHE